MRTLFCLYIVLHKFDWVSGLIVEITYSVAAWGLQITRRLTEIGRCRDECNVDPQDHVVGAQFGIRSRFLIKRTGESSGVSHTLRGDVKTHFGNSRKSIDTTDVD